MSAHSFVADIMNNVPIEITFAIRKGGVINDAKLYACSGSHTYLL